MKATALFVAGSESIEGGAVRKNNPARGLSACRAGRK
jgi:hypothetical protein